MPKIAFSDVGLRGLAPPAKGQFEVWDNKLPAFGLRVSQGGTKTFILRRNNSRITLGRFGIITLSEARTAAKRVLAEFTLGRSRPHSVTYPYAIQQFIEDKKRSRRANTYEGYEWLLNHFPFKGQLNDIAAADISRALGSIKSPSTHNHALVALRIFFNWAIKRRYVSDNPTFGLSPHSTTSRSRVLTDSELRSVWGASAKLGQYGSIVRLLILSGQRRGEIAALRTDWFEEDACTLPKDVCKNSREHTFPIGAMAAEILNTLPSSGLLFPARGKDTCFNGWSKSKTQLDKETGVTNWTLHDIRRTFATIHARIGTPIHVTEKLLNHVSGSHGGIVSVYQRHTWLPEMRRAVSNYEAHLRELFSG